MLSRRTTSGRAVERLGKLAEIVDLDLDLDQMAGKGARLPDRGADRAGDGDVVVLDEDRVVEAEAVIGAAAAADGVFLEGAKAGRRLARIADPGVRVGDAGDEAGGRRGDARRDGRDS